LGKKRFNVLVHGLPCNVPFAVNAKRLKRRRWKEIGLKFNLNVFMVLEHSKLKLGGHKNL
jgi:hypothetical protein